ncbi:HIT domain-containing protein [Mariprofundus sp. EBB-1]|uniref:HIT domain-containing protein n=1 Tax=Mariprofundus sp. EBB-1 TaxID=2650971 RepID=UPI000EF23B0E|nr:HIT domain-containing protein [Mariprofundus sp. EBB-1]RLL51748.1 HIT domain-containing protein [Mariprofundus sp. EBB-1]
MILHPQLEKDCVTVGRFPLSLLLLINDSNYPWFILVPQREHIREIHQLSEIDQQQLMHESSVLAECIEQAFNADKINIAALGNMVPQLHVHHIVRYTTDKSWPAPVWGNVPASPYSADDSNNLCIKMRLLLKEKQLQ